MNIKIKALIIPALCLAMGLQASAQSAPTTATKPPLCESGLYEGASAEYCGVTAVPADHFAEAGISLALPYRWVESNNPDADHRPPVMWLNGGPGLSNLKRAPLGEFLKDFNILFVGYRGVDTEPDLSCPEIGSAITSARRVLGDGVEATRKAIGQCLDQLENKGHDPLWFTVAQTIHDASHAQRLLGIDRVHIVAGSFGTRLGLLYQERFPENVARSVFIGANPPGRTIWTPQSIDAVLSRIAASCADPTACRASPQETLAALRYRSADDLRFLGFKFDGERARIASFLLAYDAGNLALIVDAFMDAQRGDTTGLWLLSLAHDPAVKASGISWGHFVLLGATADHEPDRDYATELSPSPAAPFGSPLAQLFWSAMPGADIPQIERDYRRLSERPHQTLLISGDLDLSAPFEQIENEIMPYRPNAAHWITPNAGHYNLYGRDLMEASATFLLHGAASPPAGQESLRLKPSLGLSDMAKIGGAAVLTGLFLIFVFLQRILTNSRNRK